ncbi:hypothetical protein AB4K20DRAFT_1866944 [Rhizopus microsporus]|uniref:Uncharacterized protein n=1 Tax=Rhizopus microsporus TaxID=58291 RepID=A0A1X0S3V1_RHIZD|nr:hypothetical protein BCV71DRAFT_234480 [Rhizopus microsporus]
MQAYWLMNASVISVTITFLRVLSGPHDTMALIIIVLLTQCYKKNYLNRDQSLLNGDICNASQLLFSWLQPANVTGNQYMSSNMLYLYFVRAEYRYINWLNDFSDYALSLKQMVLLIDAAFFWQAFFT